MRRDVLELIVEETTGHSPEWFDRSRGFRFFSRRGRAAPQRKLGPLQQVRATVGELRERGLPPAAVCAWVETETPFTPREVFRGRADAFERACYAAVSTM